MTAPTTITTTDGRRDPVEVRGDLAGDPGPTPPDGGRSPRPRAAAATARRAGATIGWATVGAAGFVVLWALLAASTPDLPTPLEAFRELTRLLTTPFVDRGPNDKGIGLQLLTSLRRVATGFAVATLIGVPLGLAIGSSKRTYAAINPIVQVLRPVSPLAWFPIWLTVSKDASKASILVILITALWPTVINTAAGASAIPSEQRNVARVFRFNKRTYLRHVLVPNALPGIVTGMRLSMGIAWMVIVAVEMLSGGAGIGFFVWDAYNAGSLAAVCAAILLIGAVGVVLDAVFERLHRRVRLEVAPS